MTEFNQHQQPPDPVGAHHASNHRAQGQFSSPYNPIRYKEWNGKRYQTSFIAALFESDNPNVAYQGTHTMGLEGRDYSIPRECVLYLQDRGDGDYLLCIGPTPVADMRSGDMKNGGTYLWGKKRSDFEANGIRLMKGCKFTCFPPHPNSKAHENGAAWTLRIDGVPREEPIAGVIPQQGQGFAHQAPPQAPAQAVHSQPQQAPSAPSARDAYQAAQALGNALGGGPVNAAEGVPEPDHQAPPPLFDGSPQQPTWQEAADRSGEAPPF